MGSHQDEVRRLFELLNIIQAQMEVLQSQLEGSIDPDELGEIAGGSTSGKAADTRPRLRRNHSGFGSVLGNLGGRPSGHDDLRSPMDRPEGSQNGEDSELARIARKYGLQPYVLGPTIGGNGSGNGNGHGHGNGSATNGRQRTAKEIIAELNAILDELEGLTYGD